MSSRWRLRSWRTPAPGRHAVLMVAQPRRGAVHDRVHRVGVVGDRDQAAGRDRRRRPGARVDLAGLGDSGVAVAHLPIDVRAAGAIGAEAVHALVGDDGHRIAADGERFSISSPVRRTRMTRVLLLRVQAHRSSPPANARREQARVATIDRGFVSRQGGGGRNLDTRPRPASRRDPRGVMATGAGDHAMPAMAGARSTVAPRAAAGRRREEPGSIR